jgi:hypothetical protein
MAPWRPHQSGAACSLINDSTKKQAELAQGFRNLIHPSRASRLNASCTLGTAYSALAAADMVAADLSVAHAARADAWAMMIDDWGQGCRLPAYAAFYDVSSAGGQAA